MTEAPSSRADATRGRLIRAAVAAFAEHGYHGTTTRDIASAAGMSPAALYVHHASKEELLYLISLAGHEELLALLRQAVDNGANPVAQLRAAIRQFTVFHVAAHESARVVNYELAALAPEHLAEIEGLRGQIVALFEGLVSRGVANGVFDVSHVRLTAVALQSLGIDAARWYRSDGWTPEQIADVYEVLALRMVGVGAASSQRE